MAVLLEDLELVEVVVESGVVVQLVEAQGVGDEVLWGVGGGWGRGVRGRGAGTASLRYTWYALWSRGQSTTLAIPCMRSCHGIVYIVSDGLYSL
jgi:hypothetical protein